MDFDFPLMKAEWERLREMLGVGRFPGNAQGLEKWRQAEPRKGKSIIQSWGGAFNMLDKHCLIEVKFKPTKKY